MTSRKNKKTKFNPISNLCYTESSSSSTCHVNQRSISNRNNSGLKLLSIKLRNRKRENHIVEPQYQNNFSDSKLKDKLELNTTYNGKAAKNVTQFQDRLQPEFNRTYAEKPEFLYLRSIYHEILHETFYLDDENAKTMLESLENVKTKISKRNNKNINIKNARYIYTYACTSSKLLSFSLFDYLYILWYTEVKLVFENYKYSFLNVYSEIIAKHLKLGIENEKIYQSTALKIEVAGDKNNYTDFYELTKKLVTEANLNVCVPLDKRPDFHNFVNIKTESMRSKNIEDLITEDTTFDEIKECIKSEIRTENTGGSPFTINCDIDATYFFIDKDKKDIFRENLLINIDDSSMLRHDKMLKNNIIYDTSDGMKKTNDLMTLLFASTQTSAGLFYIYLQTTYNRTDQNARDDLHVNLTNNMLKWYRNLNPNFKYACNYSATSGSFYQRKSNNNTYKLDFEQQQLTDNVTHKKFHKDLPVTLFHSMLCFIYENDTSKQIKGILIRSINNKKYFIGLTWPTYLHNELAKVFYIENFTYAYVDAAFSIAPKIEDDGHLILIQNGHERFKNKEYNILGSKLLTNINGTLNKLDKRKNTCSIPIEGCTKINLYSTFFSQIMPRSLKTSNGLNLTLSVIFEQLTSILKIKNTNTKLYEELQKIKNTCKHFSNDNFGYRLEATMPLYSFTTFLEKMNHDLLNSSIIKVKTTDICMEIISIVSAIQKIMTKKRKNIYDLKELAVAEVLLFNHFLKGRLNVHQLKSSQLRKYIKENFSFDHIYSIDYEKAVEITLKQVDDEADNELVTSLLTSKYNHNKRYKKMLTLLKVCIEARTTTDYINLFNETYSKLYKSLSKKKKMIETTEKDAEKHLTIDNYIYKLFDMELPKQSAKYECFYIIRILIWLGKLDRCKWKEIITEQNRIHEYFFAILYCHEIKQPYLVKLVKNQSEIDTSMTTTALQKQNDASKIELVNKIRISIQQKLPFCERREYTIEEKAHIIKAFRQKSKNESIVKTLESDIRYGLLGIRTNSQIYDAYKNFRKMCNRNNKNNDCIQKINSINDAADKSNIEDVGLQDVIAHYTDYGVDFSEEEKTWIEKIIANYQANNQSEVFNLAAKQIENKNIKIEDLKDSSSLIERDIKSVKHVESSDESIKFFENYVIHDHVGYFEPDNFSNNSQSNIEKSKKTISSVTLVKKSVKEDLSIPLPDKQEIKRTHETEDCVISEKLEPEKLDFEQILTNIPPNICNQRKFNRKKDLDLKSPWMVAFVHILDEEFKLNDKVNIYEVSKSKIMGKYRPKKDVILLICKYLSENVKSIKITKNSTLFLELTKLK